MPNWKENVSVDLVIYTIVLFCDVRHVSKTNTSKYKCLF